MDDRTEREILARLDYIERYLVNNGKVTGFANGSGIGGDIVAMAQAGRKIDAIKMYRERTGASLQQARDAIELALIRGY